MTASSLANVAAAALSSFRVYTHEPAAAYRETVTHRNCDSLLGIALMALRAASVKTARSRSKTFGFRAEKAFGATKRL
jgi:hypothetical protein